MKNSLLVIYSIIICITYSNELSDNDNTIGLNTKNEMVTWESRYPKSLGIGFGSSTPFNNNLSVYSENGQSTSKWFQFKLSNFYNFNFENREFNLSIIGGTENFYMINNLNFWGLFSLQFFDLINIGIGNGINIVFHQFNYEEISAGLIFDLNTPMPLNIYKLHSTIGLSFKHIFTKFENIELLGSYNSQIFNFYINLELPWNEINFN